MAQYIRITCYGDHCNITESATRTRAALQRHQRTWRGQPLVQIATANKGASMDRIRQWLLGVGDPALDSVFAMRVQVRSMDFHTLCQHVLDYIVHVPAEDSSDESGSGSDESGSDSSDVGMSDESDADGEPRAEGEVVDLIDSSSDDEIESVRQYRTLVRGQWHLRAEWPPTALNAPEAEMWRDAGYRVRGTYRDATGVWWIQWTDTSVHNQRYVMDYPAGTPSPLRR